MTMQELARKVRFRLLLKLLDVSDSCALALSRALSRNAGTPSRGLTPEGTRETAARLMAEEGIDLGPLNDWFCDLAAQTQIIEDYVKLSIKHGEVLYRQLERFLAERPELAPLQILEVGTAMGFSSVLMAHCLDEAGRDGGILTCDIMRNDQPMNWNCLWGTQGPQSRRQGLADYQHELRRISYFQGSSRLMAGLLELPRVHFAFLDGQHDEPSVSRELAWLA
ncbi:MAG TPA: class I SAM-dependent methyltransferase, partial [Alphaproteobacteria bacterium]|nr:class I SAM-dependent methyltransferase [Alphaproteobacteria bacterium]